MEMTEWSQVLSKLTYACSQSEHCSHEIIEKMKKAGVDEAGQQKILDYLKSERYIDDERYCRYFVKDKVRFNKWGRKKIEQALRMKHISSSVYCNILDDIDENEYIEALLPALKSKQKTTRGKTEYEITAKLIRFAMGRGYTYDIIEKCLKKLSISSLQDTVLFADED